MNKQTELVGLMGCGAVADYGYVPAIQKSKNLVLYALYDPNAEVITHIQKKYNVAKAFTNVDEFFASGIKAVSITSPASEHKENILSAAQYKLPILCEKSLAMNNQEASDNKYID